MTDLLGKPEALARLADALADPAFLAPIPPTSRRVVLTGMGSSRYAVEAPATRPHGGHRCRRGAGVGRRRLASRTGRAGARDLGDRRLAGPGAWPRPGAPR